MIVCAAVALFYYYGHDLPNHEFLQNYRPPEGSRIYNANNDLYRELVSEYRIFVPIHEIPPKLIKAFLAAEDKNFYYHPGVDVLSLMRAVVSNTLQGNWKENPVGASTITQQVAKNFLVGNERSFARKVREAIMSMRIENALTKDRILELYFNQIYLGMRSYGVAAAAYTYFQKSLQALTLGECAFLASLPKAPANYHPVREPKKALTRRNWTLKRLAEEGVVSYVDAQSGQNEPLNVTLSARLNQISYVSEEIKRELVQRFKDNSIYQDGLSVYTSLNVDLQTVCEGSLRSGLELYDKRHGYRGALLRMTPLEMKIWHKSLMEKINTLHSFPKDRKIDIALVLQVAPDFVEIGFSDGRKGMIYDDVFVTSSLAKTTTVLSKKKVTLSSILHEGDVIVTMAVLDATGEKHYQLDQIPIVTGAMVVMDADTGEISAMTGGYSPDISQFNCATQAIRQPGSSFKPFVYLAALELGYTKDTIIDDSPIEVILGPGLGIYAPKNATHKSLGPTPLYQGLEQSINQMTVRLAHQIGMAPIQAMAKRLGIIDNMPPQLAMSLGAGETTLLKITAAYATIVNGGKRVYPHLVKRVHDRFGQLIFQMPPAFDDHLFKPLSIHANILTDDRVQTVEHQYAEQIQDMLRGVVARGTARKINYLREQYGLDIGGKTGTTNDYKDAWFIGFVRFPSGKAWIVGTFVGFSSPKSLGAGEGGGRAAVPIFESFVSSMRLMNN
ncbi:MAG: PBP1A family penicillin-binding protein [Pseudomonadota bacterium]